eukprot:9818290-Alexandrium_andersonii.AAC.1
MAILACRTDHEDGPRNRDGPNGPTLEAREQARDLFLQGRDVIGSASKGLLRLGQARLELWPSRCAAPALCENCTEGG